MMMRLGLWRGIAGLLLFWLFIIIYLNSSLLQSNSDINDKTERQLGQALSELEQLRVQNDNLYKLAATIKSLKLSSPQGQWGLTALRRKLNVSEGPGILEERQRRRLERGITDLWFYLDSSLHKLKSQLSSEQQISEVEQIIELGSDRKRALVADLSAWTDSHSGEWRRRESKRLGGLVQSRLDKLQNPPDCNTAKKVLCNVNKGCGFGCQLHHVTYCLIIAYGTGRTLVLDSKGWRYNKLGWEKVFLPLSRTCTDRQGASKRGWGAENIIRDTQVIELPIVDSIHPRPDYMPLAVPQDLLNSLNRFHGNPITWFVGQLVRYLMRPQPYLQDYIDKVKKDLGFKNPVVGIHIRRTDKVGTEAAFHGIEEYMKFAEDFYKTLDLVRVRGGKDDKVSNAKPKVYIASDDPTVLPEAKSKYADYDILGDVEISRSAGLGSRYTSTSLRGIILDIILLSECDYVVCTFSSQVCRVAYELMQTHHADASARFHSLDDVWYFGGQTKHDQLAVQDHHASRSGEISFNKGDWISIAGDHWNGYSKGRNRRTGKVGLYPSYKVEEVPEGVKIPGYEKSLR